ncbi:MAG: hypothetical protein ACI4JD_07685 [Ruminococcus sp.]
MENDEKVLCPLIDKKISIVDCMENRETKDESIPEAYKQKTDWKNICRNCKYYDY